jgi:phosphoribosylformylglycinamidine synthase
VDVDLQGVAAATEWRDVATLFGESASRAVVSVSSEQVDRFLAMAAAANVPAARLGVVGGDRIRVSVEGVRVLDEPLAAAEAIWSTAIEAYFERRRAGLTVTPGWRRTYHRDAGQIPR